MLPSYSSFPAVSRVRGPRASLFCSVVCASVRWASTSPSSESVRISRVPREKLQVLFPPSQRQQFPRHYLPASGVAAFLRPEGVPLGDLLDCYQALTQQLKASGSSSAPGPSVVPVTDIASKEDQESANELRRDFASDYILWSRAVLEDYVEDHLLRGISSGAGVGRERGRSNSSSSNSGGGSSSGTEQATNARKAARYKKWFRQWTSREVLLADAAVRELFLLGPHLPPPPPALAAPSGKRNPLGAPPPPPPHATSPDATAYYTFTPHAALQQLALRPLSDCRSPNDLVRLTTFPQLHNIFSQEWDSLSPLRTLCHYAGERLVYTRELVLHMATYLRQALEEVVAREPGFAGAHPPTRPQNAPILTFFGNGRLAHELNATGILPCPVIAVRLKSQEVEQKKSRRLAQQELEKGTSVLPQCDHFRSVVHPNLGRHPGFHCETVRTVADALRKYEPALVIAEPHRGGKDYFADLRGYYTVRRVVALGPLDGPAMGSMWFPFLSFGVSPGPTTYLVYNEHLQQVSAASRIQMPVDPPHEAQGYTKRYLDDEISTWLIAPNDVAALPHQYRAMVFERVVFPVLRKPKVAAPPTDEDPKADAPTSSSPLEEKKTSE